jgi:solute carrier family 45 protein 1/2/4
MCYGFGTSCTFVPVCYCYCCVLWAVIPLLPSHYILVTNVTYSPWAIACWAPITFLGIEVNRLSSGAGPAYHARARRFSIELDSPTTPRTPGSPSVLRLEHGPSDDSVASTGELSGLYFGILNIYTTLPQFVGTFISMVVFGILEPGKSPELAQDAHPSERHGTDGPNAIAVCLFIGSLSTVGAAYATKKLRDLQRGGEFRREA